MRRLLTATTLALVFLVPTLAACGTGGNAYTPPASAPTTPPQATGVVIHTATATVGGKSTSVLTNATGMTLYYFTPDSPTAVACSGTCASIWPPLLSHGSLPTASPALSGVLSVVAGANGKQVTYNGHPLYIYSGDSKPGDTNGEGLQGKWYVATPDLAQNTGGSGGY